MQWARDHGLHLIATNVVLAREYLELLDRACVLHFHCTKCLTELLTHVRTDLGLKKPVLKNIWTRVDPNRRREFTAWRPRRSLLGNHILENAFSEFQSTMVRMYGAFEIVYDEFNRNFMQGPDRKWLVEKVRVVGRLPKRLKTHDVGEAEGAESEPSIYDDDVTEAEDDDEGGEDDEDALRNDWQQYAIIEGVIELKRWRQRWDVSDSGGEPLRRVRRRIQDFTYSSCDDDWRPLSRDLTGATVRRKRRNLVCRDEVWLGVVLP